MIGPPWQSPQLMGSQPARRPRTALHPPVNSSGSFLHTAVASALQASSPPCTRGKRAVSSLHPACSGLPQSHLAEHRLQCVGRPQMDEDPHREVIEAHERTRRAASHTRLEWAHGISHVPSSSPMRASTSAAWAQHSVHGGSSNASVRSSDRPRPAPTIDQGRCPPQQAAAHSFYDPSFHAAHRPNSPCSLYSPTPSLQAPSHRPLQLPPRTATPSCPDTHPLPGTLRPPKCWRSCTRHADWTSTSATPPPTDSSVSRSRTHSAPSSLQPTPETPARSLLSAIPPCTAS